MEPEGSSPCSQEPSTGPYPQPDESSPYYPIYLRSISILSSHLRLGLSADFYSSGFTTEILYSFLLFPVRAICLAYTILIDVMILIRFGEEYR
jgi:hypothetical protein